MPRYHRYKYKKGGYFRGRSRTGRYYTRGCFPSGALVLTPSQWKPISEIKAGDEVISFNCTSLSFDAEIVCQRRDCKTSMIFEINIENQDHPTTANHPFLTSRGWVEAQHLQSGDRLKSLTEGNTSDKIVSNVCITHRMELVHNLITTGSHTYIVSGYIVHNYNYFRSLRTLFSNVFIDWKWRKFIKPIETEA